MKNNSKDEILGRVKNSSFNLEKDKIKKDDDLKDKMGQMLEVAEKVKDIFDSLDDFNLFLKLLSQMEKTFTKEKTNSKR